MGCSSIQLYGYLLIRNNIQYVCLQHVKMNSVDKKKVSGKLADEGLHLIWVGIQEGIQNTLVLRNGPEVYLQLKCSTKNCQVGFKIRRKHNYTETNQWEKINKLQTNAIYLLELFFVLRPRVIINSRR